MNHRRQNAMTLMELVVAMTIIVVIMSVLLPQFRVMYRSFDLRQASAETLQGAAVFTSHFQQMLAQAAAITAVSGSSVTSGYIEFTHADGLAYRYDLSGGNIRFGLQASPQYMAGPVSSLVFSCYQQSDLNTPIADPALVDYIKVDAVFSDSTGCSQTQSISAAAALGRTPVSGSEEDILVHLELDESSGLTAEDSSGNELSGELHFSSEDPWCEGITGNALDFNGITDVLTILDHASLDLTDQGTVAAWIYVRNHRPFAGIIHKGDLPDFSDEAYTLQFWTNNRMMFSVVNNSTTIMVIDTVALSTRTWHHVLGKWDSTGVYLYVDGECRAWNSTAIVARNSSGRLHIGAQLYEEPSYYYGIIGLDGLIDDVRIYSYALTENQIQQIAEAP